MSCSGGSSMKSTPAREQRRDPRPGVADRQELIGVDIALDAIPVMRVTINDAVDFPIIIYNIPTRSVVHMSVDTVARLARLAT